MLMRMMSLQFCCVTLVLHGFESPGGVLSQYIQEFEYCSCMKEGLEEEVEKMLKVKVNENPGAETFKLVNWHKQT